jgi:hypothetical protein
VPRVARPFWVAPRRTPSVRTVEREARRLIGGRRRHHAGLWQGDRRQNVEANDFANVLERLVFAVPFKLANKTFMASLGVFSYVQQEFDKQYKAFDKQFTRYAKDGEKVFDRMEDRVEDFRKDVEKKVDVAYDRVRDTISKAA